MPSSKSLSYCTPVAKKTRVGKAAAAGQLVQQSMGKAARLRARGKTVAANLHATNAISTTMVVETPKQLNRLMTAATKSSSDALFHGNGEQVQDNFRALLDRPEFREVLRVLNVEDACRPASTSA